MEIIKHKLALLCTLLLLRSKLETNANTAATTCFATKAKRGESATITCDFKRDVRQLAPVSVTVERYPFTDISREVQVLSCQLMNENEQPLCTPIEGYTLKGEIGSTLQLEVESASEEFAGRYACKRMSKDENPEPEICSFNVTGQSPSTTKDGIILGDSESEEGTDILVIVLPVLAVIVLVALGLGLRCYCRKRKTRNKTNKSQMKCIDDENKDAEPSTPRNRNTESKMKPIDDGKKERQEKKEPSISPAMKANIDFEKERRRLNPVQKTESMEPGLHSYNTAGASLNLASEANNLPKTDEEEEEEEEEEAKIPLESDLLIHKQAEDSRGLEEDQSSNQEPSKLSTVKETGNLEPGFDSTPSFDEVDNGKTETAALADDILV